MTDDDVPLVTGRPPWHPPAEPRPGWTPFPPEAVEASLGHRLVEVAAEHGDRPALRGPGGRRTHAELAEFTVGRARTLRQRLDRADTGSEPAAIAVVAGHDIALMEAILAVVSSGHPVLVLDPAAPDALNATLLADSGAPLVVSDAEHEAYAEGLAAGRDVVALDHIDLDPGPLPEVDPAAVAVLAYTSGTSGDPKAAMVPHRQLLHLMRGATDALAIGPDDRLPMLFPLSLAVASYPAFLPLLNGGSLTTFDVRGQGFADLGSWLAGEQVTVAYLAPTVVKFLEGSLGDHAFPDLRLIVLGGERVDQAAVDLTRDLFGASALVANGYGTTETGVLTFWFTDGDTREREATIPVGHPIPGMSLRIVNDVGRVVGPGQTGELVVAGHYLFAGYRNHPDLDDAVLGRDPVTGEAVYRTGDLGRVDAQGALELVGRVDTQVKVRGRRVVLGEVEDALLGLDVVRDAAVVAGSDGSGHTEVVAHVVPEPPDGGVVTADRIRAALAETAPPQMVPARFVLHEALPQLPNGKLDRLALVEVVGSRPALSTVYAPPHSDLEIELVDLWQELIGLAPVGVDDDFFDLGGNSLLAAQMLIELEDRLGHRVPMAALVDGITVRDLAVAVSEHEEGRLRPAGLVNIQGGDPDRPVLYIAHDLHGSAFRFRHLAAALGEDQPVKGFESPALTGERFPFTRIETLALRYVTEMQRTQPEGPYHLCGYSFGGIVAFEMARHLRRAGEEVALLAVVDIGPGYRGIDYDRSRPPRGPWLDLPAPPEPGARWRRRLGRFAAAVRQSPRDAGAYVVFNSRFRRRLLPVSWWWQLRRHGRVPARHRLWYAYQKHWELVGPSWAGAPYDGEVTLFWSDDTASADATMGWAALGATVDIHRIAVAHERIMDEAEVRHLAEPLRQELDRR